MARGAPGVARPMAQGQVTMLLEAVPPPGEWVADAACAGLDTDIFMPERGESTAPAREVCAGCPVAAKCAAYALAHSQLRGVWGGLSERQRREARRAAAAEEPLAA